MPVILLALLFLLVELLERSRQVEHGPQYIDYVNGALPAYLDAEPPPRTDWPRFH